MSLAFVVLASDKQYSHGRRSAFSPAVCLPPPLGRPCPCHDSVLVTAVVLLRQSSRGSHGCRSAPSVQPWSGGRCWVAHASAFGCVGRPTTSAGVVRGVEGRVTPPPPPSSRGGVWVVSREGGSPPCACPDLPSCWADEKGITKKALVDARGRIVKDPPRSFCAPNMYSPCRLRESARPDGLQCPMIKTKVMIRTPCSRLGCRQ